MAQQSIMGCTLWGLGRVAAFRWQASHPGASFYPATVGARVHEGAEVRELLWEEDRCRCFHAHLPVHGGGECCWAMANQVLYPSAFYGLPLLLFLRLGRCET